MTMDDRMRHHWHGAAVDAFMGHVAGREALPDGDDPTTGLEPGTEELYRAGSRG